MERAARLAGLELAPDTDVTVEGDDPVLPTPFHLGAGVSAALALLGQESDRIWQARGGRAQALSIDVRHAVASLMSYHLLRLPGLEQRVIPVVTGIHECGDGRYILLHGSFDHTEGILDELVLGAEATAEDVAAACMRRGAFELEDALAARGKCAVVCRSSDEWLAHPQGALLATKPVVEVTRIGDAPPRPFPAGKRPLDGVRVLDLTRVLAGPTCARTLAEHGADVLHIASPNLPTIPIFEMDTGHGKRQAYLDLDSPAEAEALRALIADADVFSQGFQHRSLERRGFGAEDLARMRPGIVYVSENAFGHEGPWQERPGWEQLAQCATGMAVAQGIERPALTGPAQNDYTTGYFAALGAMTALRRRAVEGGSWLVRVSLSQTAMWYQRLGADLDRTAAPGLGDVSGFLDEEETLYGPMTHLRPPLRMAETTPRWSIPSTPPGAGAPVWV
ncbi:MAG: CoA transferase [Dehalococcoidia bacterium]